MRRKAKMTASQFVKLATRLTAENLAPMAPTERERRIKSAEQALDAICRSTPSKPAESVDTSRPLGYSRVHTKS